MRSLLGRFHRPFARSAEEQLLLLNNLGDGSTLSLDFTTGVLDPRLTFDRLSTATFINSSGLVQFANANLMTYSTPRASGSAWATTGTATWGSATITDPLGNATAQEVTFGTAASAIFNTTGTTVVSGITHTFSVWLRAASGTTNVRIGDANVGAVSTVTLTTTWQRFSCQYVASGTNDGGAVYSQTGTPSSTFYVWGAQVQPGSIVGELLETTGTLRRNTPRFDYDPTSIGTPRGLLIEGSANNLCLRSEDFGNASWQVDNSGATNPVVSTVSQTAPNGASSVNRVTLNKTGGTFSRLYQAITGTAGQTYTMSVWMKANTANGGAATQNVSLRIGGSNGVNCVVTTTWQRFTHPAFAITGTDANFQLLLWDNVPANDETADVLVWGAQVELGSGASSYIPTGASQGSRAAESCALALSAFPFVTSEGSFVVRYDAPRANLGASLTSILNTDYEATEWIGLFQSVSSVTVSLGSWSGQSNISAGTVTSNIAAFSYGAWTGSVVPVSFVVNNSAVTNANRDWNPALPTWLMIGAASSAGSSTASRDWLNSCIRSVKYWPTRLPDAQLQALTT